MKIKILIIHCFTNPHHSGEEITTYQYDMKDALKAEERYLKLKKGDENSGGLSSTQILITQVIEDKPKNKELEEIDLENNQSTFIKHKKNWYDRKFEFRINFKFGVPELSHYCDVTKGSWFIKNLKSLEDLKETYEKITNEEFK